MALPLERKANPWKVWSLEQRIPPDSLSHGEGGLKEHSAKQKLRETHSVTYVPGLSTLSDLLRIVDQLYLNSSVAYGHLHTIHPA